MSLGIARPSRAASRLVLAAGLGAAVAGQSFAATLTWSTGSGSWFNPANWSPFGLPSSGDTVHIGSHPAAVGATVLLGAPGFTYGALQLENGVTLDTNGGELVSFGQALIVGAGTRLIVRSAAGPNQQDFQGRLTLGSNAILDLRDNVAVRLFAPSTSAGSIVGNGLIISTIDNNGVIRPGASGGITIQAGQPIPDQMYDLDGASGMGDVLLDTPGSSLEIMAQGLVGQFSGDITMAPGATLTMSLSNTWETGHAFDLIVTGSGNPASPSVIEGAGVTLRGVVDIGGVQGALRLAAPVTFLSGLTSIGLDSDLEVTSTAFVEGMSFQLAEDATLRFQATASVNSGMFSTASSSLLDGGIYFNSTTFWSGSSVIDGAARTNAFVIVNSQASIDVGMLDMDGSDGSTQWDVNAALTVSADQIGTSPSNFFAGSMDIGGTASARVQMNLTDPQASWIVTGELNLVGLGALTPVRIGGSPLQLKGQLALSSGSVQISADTTILGGPAGATVLIPQAPSILRMNGHTVVQAGAMFAGDGAMRNSATGDMRLDNGASLGDIGLINDGVLKIGEAVGIASVDRLQLGATSVWKVSLGGLTPGAEHDALLVSDGVASVQGELLVTHADLGGGVFRPQIGDEFVIVNAVGGVSGAFATDPSSNVGPQRYEWKVIYNPNSVVLRLDQIVCLGDVNGDGVIDFQDLNLLLSAFNTTFGNAGYNPNADFDGNGIVDFADLNTLLSGYNQSCG